MYEKSTAKLKLIVRVTYCLTFGFLIVMIVAFLCRWFLVRPSQSEISLNLAYSGADLARCVGGDAWVAALSPDAEVLNDHGIGFRLARPVLLVKRVLLVRPVHLVRLVHLVCLVLQV